MKRDEYHTLNYEHICGFCGESFMSNRSTAKFCSDQHRSLAYADEGLLIPEITTIITDNPGRNAELLGQLHMAKPKNENNWSKGYDIFMLLNVGYKGIFPSEGQLLFIDSFALIKVWIEKAKGYFYFIKPLQALTNREIFDLTKGRYKLFSR